MVRLASLIDPSLAGPFVPTSVFTGIQSTAYWSATAKADVPATAWAVDFGNGNVFDTDKTSNAHAWCVRGGMNADRY